MTTENDGFDVNSFFDERAAEAGLDENESVTDSPENEETLAFKQEVPGQQEAETEQAETLNRPSGDKAAVGSAEDIQAALESASEGEETVSVLESLLPKAEELEQAERKRDSKGQYVPVEEHIKLRKRAQEAEKQRDELLQRLNSTQTGGEKLGEIEKSPLEKFVDENPDEDFIPAKIQLEQKRWEESMARANAESIAQREEQQRLEAEERQRKLNTINAYRTRATDLENNFRKEHSDYDQITKPITENNQLTQQDKMAILKSDNPAQKLYEICKAKRDSLLRMLGIQQPSNQTPAKTPKLKPNAAAEQVADEDVLSDEEILESVFGKKDY